MALLVTDTELSDAISFLMHAVVLAGERANYDLYTDEERARYSNDAAMFTVALKVLVNRREERN